MLVFTRLHALELGVLNLTTQHLTTAIDMSEFTKEKRVSNLDGAYRHASRGEGVTEAIEHDVAILGYEQKLVKNRSMYTILFQSLAITAVPFGEGTALTSAIYGGGQLSYFVGWIVVSILDQCLFVSLAELCSKFPTSAGPVSLIKLERSSVFEGNESDSSSTTSRINFCLTMDLFAPCCLLSLAGHGLSGTGLSVFRSTLVLHHSLEARSPCIILIGMRPHGSSY